MSKENKDSKVIKDLSKEKLSEQLRLLKRELFNMRFQKALGDFANTSRFAKVRKEVARINTEITQRNIKR